MQAEKKNLKIYKIKSTLPFEANCYVVIKENSAIIIDPCITYKQALEIVKKNSLKTNIDAVFVSHGHIDHFYYINQYVEFVNNLYYHKNAVDKMSSLKKSYAILTDLRVPFTNHSKTIFVKDKDVIEIEDLSCKIIYTPGHSNCSISILIDDALFTGDTLFYHSVGRSDLYTGSEEELLKSIKYLMRSFPDVIIYPGHEELSNMEEEISNNPYVQI